MWQKITLFTEQKKKKKKKCDPFKLCVCFCIFNSCVSDIFERMPVFKEFEKILSSPQVGIHNTQVHSL